MKSSKRWSVVPTTIAAVLALAGVASSQIVAISPNSSAVMLNGTSGGTKKDSSCAGFVADTPNHTIQVTADSNLRFSLKGAGQPTLLITGVKGQAVCVQADSLSGGKIEIPGRWIKGNYSVYVGDRAQGRNPYTLSITPR
ncbi:hypothetical protein C7B65_15370 [Phormidesmis priestleyi ULC007]|uniref:Uncharacterized protein n=1 Tax=Phormidesmis priestleyi ULC007 TaxID=1920490 RepID=A0A2T1DDF8_9CYAN|nr:hypothetical protein [Phormidesmis priestleyi]PSB18471.1 hypothetical protein C7B65_15370 [Phormidesmis priestleyi ULC007]PZO48802.1 MAG: hypothetical protein DCF14_15820 [Phormidesmis priestleyi]